MKKQTPADVVISAFDGVRATARLLGRSPAAVSLWRKPAPKGIAGRVPSRLHQDVLRESHRLGLGITADDLIFGRGYRRVRG